MEAYSGDVTIRFRVSAPNNPNVFVTGDIVELGKGRLDRALKLTPASDGFFEGSIKLAMPKKSEFTINYKYCSQYNFDYKEEQSDRTLLILAGQKFIQKIDEYCEYYQALPVGWRMQIEQLVGRAVEKKKPLGKPPKDTFHVQFVVKATLKHPTERVIIFGNNKFLGNWEVRQGKSMTYTLLKWELDCFMPPSNFPLEYKYAIVDQNGQISADPNTRKVLLADLAEKQAKGQNVSVKINDQFDQAASGVTFPYEEYFYPNFGQNAINYSDFRELLYLDSHTGKLTAGNSFYAQLALNCGKECVITTEHLTTHDLANSDLVHEQLCKSLMDPQCTVETLCLGSSYFAKISQKRIAMLNHVLENNHKITQLNMLFDSCCEPENKSETEFIYQGLASGKFKFIKTAMFQSCDFEDPWPIMEILNNESLTGVQFYDCYLSADFGSHVINQLKSNTNLTSVVLRQEISKYEMETLRKVLTTNKTLTALTLGPINCDLQPFSETLKNNTTLKKLTIEYGKKEIACLFTALKSNQTLQQFSLSIISEFNYSDQLIPEVMHDLFRSNMTLTNMEILTRPPFAHKYLVREFTSRNKQLQQTVHNNLIVALFNIARQSATSLQLFPSDIWLYIVSHIPGRAYDKILRTLFDDCTPRKVS